jgi:signal transduction histidine kinase/AraC-like DNA-binding protein/streptogramin lyase
MSASAFRTTHYTEGFSKDQLSCSSVFSVFNDTFGNVWLGTWGGGVNFISHLPQMFNCIVYGPNKDDETLTAKSAPGVCIAPNGDLWVGTEGGGINIFHSGHRIATLTQENGALPDNVLMTAHNDSHGALWFGTFSGWIYRFNASTRALQKVRILSGNHSDIRCFYENRDHQMCVGTSSGIFLLDLATMKTLKHYEISNSRLPEQLVRSICQDAQGRYWVGTFGNGMAVLSPDMQRGKWFNTNNHFCSNTINHIIQGRNYTMWAATDNGVVRFPVNNPDHYVCYQQQEGIANTNTHSLAEDRKGNIWVSSNKGLSCIATAQKRIYNFSNTSDIGYGEFCSDAVVTDPRGYIYFGYNGGVCFFNPNDAKPTSTLPPVRFTQIEVLKGTINNTGRFISLANEPKVTLHHDENTFSIGFNLRDNALRGRVYYAYRLKELNNTWFEVGHDQEVTFRNLPYGKYTLEVKARIDEQWSAPSAAVVIDIQPPFWSSAWARALYILLFLAVALEISRRYRRHLLRRNKYKIEQANREKETELNNERLRFYTNIAHELRTPLTLIIGPLDDMLRNYTLVDTLRHKIELVNKNANRLLELVTQILEFRKTETQNRTLKVARQNLPNVIKEEWLKFKEANKNPDLVFSIDLSDPNLTLYFDKEVVTIIIDNLLSNAVKYTLSGSIVTTMTTRREEEKTMVDVSIIDTGYGIDSEALPHLFDRFYQAGGEHQSYGTGIGLALVKSLSTLHQGTISVRSDVGKGSTFTFSLRIDNTYPEALHTDHEEPAALPEETPATTYSEPDDKRPLVIVVEDNTDIADYIKESLSEQYDVVTAPNGQVGLNKALQLTPDIVVSDVMMPVMDGIELCQQLKNDIRTSHIPVILLTAKDTLENKKEGYIAGADSYITKPFSSSLLLTRINNLLETRRKLAQKMDITQLSEKKEQLNVYINQHDNDFINRVSDIINDNLAEESLDITFVADRMNMSSSSLYRKMKALTGLSANAFIHKIKMNTAEKMLIERKLTISEIAFKLGFSSPSYFRHCFKDDYGIAPSDFVKRLSQTSKDKTSR